MKLINKNNMVTKKQIAKGVLVNEITVERQVKMANVKYVGRGDSWHLEIGINLWQVYFPVEWV